MNRVRSLRSTAMEVGADPLSIGSRVGSCEILVINNELAHFEFVKVGQTMRVLET